MLFNFDQILTKSDQILTIYVKNHQIHVKKIQGRHFLRKKPLRECQHIAQGLIIPKIHIRIDPFATLVPKLPKIKIKYIKIYQNALKPIKNA